MSHIANKNQAWEEIDRNEFELSMEERREIENLGSGKTNDDSEVHQNVRTTNEVIESTANTQFLIALDHPNSYEDESLSQAIAQFPNALDNAHEHDDESFSQQERRGSDRCQRPIKNAHRHPKTDHNAESGRDKQLACEAIEAQRK